MSNIQPEPAASAYAYPLLIKHLLYTPLAVAPEQEIVYADIKRYTYATLRERIGRLGSALTAIGIQPGNTVAVMDWDSHRYLECFYAVPMIGAVLHTVNIRLSPEQILYTINHAEDDAILIHSDFLPLLEQIRDRIENPVKLVLLTDDGASPDDPAFEGEYEALLAAGDPAHEFQDFDENTRATTFYTTGTTGDPKGVYYSHRQLVIHTLAAMASFAIPSGQGTFSRDDVYMPITPMFHVHAWGIPYVATLLGVKQVYPGRYVPENLLATIAREGVTFSHCVPTILHMLLNHPEAKNTSLDGWKCIVGGSALPKGLGRQAMAMGIDLFSGYGMSETCPVLTTAHLEAHMLGGDVDEQLDIRCKAGRPLPLVDLRVVDEDMNDVPHDGVSSGEVVVRAPWLTQGYLKNPETSEELWRGGYLHTGDMGDIDEQGYLRVTDRIKDVIKTGGEWISSLTLEDLISEHPSVGEVAAIGIPDEKWGERPIVIVVPRADHAGGISADELKAIVREQADQGVVSSWAVPDRVEIVDEIPKTSVGKINKKLLRQQYS